MPITPPKGMILKGGESRPSFFPDIEVRSPYSGLLSARKSPIRLNAARMLSSELAQDTRT
jgi:hypothetical protein